MNILIIEPFFGGSHKTWIEGYKKNSSHSVEMLTLAGSAWKERMRTGAETLASEFLASGYSPDLIFASDMLDLEKFLALTEEKTAAIPTAIYFHENQLTYPWSPRDKKAEENRAFFGTINIKSALAADSVFFNSAFHMESFLTASDLFIKGSSIPEVRELLNNGAVDAIRTKSSVLYLGMALKGLKAEAESEGTKNNSDIKGGDASPPLILWNHRWEYDKNPTDFFNALYALMEKGITFEVAILGEHFERIPKEFSEAREKLGERVVAFGYLPSRADYARWLKRADILPVTSIHDFFGSSVVEAISLGAFPLLPERLAYPEHISPTEHPESFYTNFEDLVSKLERAIADIETTRAIDLSPLVDRYDWGEQAPLYDKTLAEAASLTGRRTKGLTLT